MNVDQKGLDMIIGFEGMMLHPYMCPAGKPTIAGGCTFYPDGRKVTMKDPAITKEKAIEMTRYTAGMFAKEVSKLIKVNLNQNQFNAILSWTYNFGSARLAGSTLLKLVNANPNNRAIVNEFMKWVNIDSKPNRGLISRRTKEAQIYFS